MALGFVKIMRDESEARVAREALEERQELLWPLRSNDNEEVRAQLVSANEAKDAFLAVLSHELRTPLTPVVMALQILELRKDLGRKRFARRTI